MEVRRILEDFSADVPKRLPILTEAYGKMLFKCPIISCTRFYRGFENREQRDKHIGQHERAHKCTHEGCDYRELGFPTEVELRRHVDLCHSVLPEEPTFPNVQRVNLSKALNDAIDREDVQAVRDICSEVLVCPLRQTGFVLRAMKRRYISTALVLIEILGTDVEMNHVDSKGRTVLHEAVQIGNDDLFDRILDTGIDVEVQDRDKFTPFLRALQQGYFHAIRSLMNHGAVNCMPWDVLQAHRNTAYDIYEKAMKKAAAGGVDDILKQLFSNFVKIMESYHKNYDRWTISRGLTQIIAKAASHGHESTVKLILELAHALDLESMYQGLLKKELHHGIEAMTKLLMQHYRNAKPEIGKNGKTYGNALANAAMKNDSALVMRLLKDGANIDYADPGLAYNALGAASSRGNLSMVSLLVEQGTDINAKGGHSGNAIYLACRGKHIAVVDFLIEKGADVNARLIDDDTALIKASSYSGMSLDAVKLLVGKAADVNLQNKSGETALYAASENCYTEVVELLVQGGADVNLQVKSGETALFRASQYGRKDTVELLVQGGADVNRQNRSGQSALLVAFERGQRETIRVLTKAEVDTEVKDSHQQTPLMQAAERGWGDIVQILIDKGADIDCQDEYQQTALLMACKKGHTEVASVLLASGAKGSNDVQLLLLGAEPNVGTSSGVYENALSHACSLGCEEYVKLLLENGARFRVPVATYDKALGLIGSRAYVPSHKYEAIAKLLRERRATISLPG